MRFERVGQRDALGVGEVADRVGVQRAGGGAAAEQRTAEARALLVGPVDELQRDLAARARAGTRARPSRRARRRASRRAGRRRCASRRRAPCRSRPAASPTGSRRRRARPPRPSRLELAEQPLARRGPVVGPGQPARSALSSGQLGQLAQVSDRALRIEFRHGVHDKRNSRSQSGFIARVKRWGSGSLRRRPAGDGSLRACRGRVGQAVVTRCDAGVRDLRGPRDRGPRRDARRSCASRCRPARRTTRCGRPSTRPGSAAGSRRRRSLATCTTRRSRSSRRRATTAPSSQFRWRDARGHTVRSERATTKVCSQPDPRPDLVVHSLKGGAHYVAVVGNDGRGRRGAVHGRVPAQRRPARHRRRPGPGGRRADERPARRARLLERRSDRRRGRLGRRRRRGGRGRQRPLCNVLKACLD